MLWGRKEMNAEGTYKEDFLLQDQRECEGIRDIFKVEDEGSSLEVDRFTHSIRGGHLLRTEVKRNGTRSRRWRSFLWLLGSASSRIF